MKFGFSSVFHFKRLENDDAIMFDPIYERKSVQDENYSPYIQDVFSV